MSCAGGQMRSFEHRVVHWSIVAFAGLMGCLCARDSGAAESCTLNWSITGGDSIGYTSSLGEPSNACLALAAVHAGFGGVQQACSVTGGIATETGIGGSGSPYAEVWTRQPAGCVDASPPDSSASAASGPQSSASVVEAVNASTKATEALHTGMLATGAVLCFAVGVFTGKQR